MTRAVTRIGASDVTATRIGVGTWAIGGSEWGGTDMNASVAAIRAAIDLGVTLIDTAPIYGFGVAETIVGEAIAGRREGLVISTKCGLRWDDRTRGEFAYDSSAGPVYRSLATTSIKTEVERSLKRLRIDCIDVYYTHYQDGSTPIAETMAALLALKRDGKIRAIGISNATVAHLDEYCAHGQVDCVQESYSMVDRSRENGLFAQCAKSGISVMAYSPLAMGMLSGKLKPSRTFAKGDVRGFSKRFSEANVARINSYLDRIKPMAEAHKITIAQLVVAWTLSRPSITHVLSGVRNAEQARENAAAGDVVLDAGEIATINRLLEESDLALPALFG